MVFMTPTFGVNHNKMLHAEATEPNSTEQITIYYNKISNFNADLNPADYTMF